MNERSVASEGMEQEGPTAAPHRDQDAIYQKGELVARVAGPKMDIEAKEICFHEIRESDHLVLADECQFRRYRILIQKIAFATKVDMRPGHKGRTLAGCTAEILGYVEG